MSKPTRALILLVITGLAVSALSAQKSRDKIEIVKPTEYAAPMLGESSALQTILSKAVNYVLASYSNGSFKPEEMAATLIDLRDPNKLQMAYVNGEARLYTASVVKMFYMAALHRQLEDGKIVLSKELERGLRDMIVDSSNEATQYILDVLTDTSSGAELPQEEFEAWQSKRNRVNRFFSSLGYQNININQKTFCEDAYGIEQQSRAYKGQNRNMLTTNATARLLAEIALRKFVSEKRSSEMLDLMKRDWEKPSKDPDNQAVGFAGKALIDGKMTGSKLWSKAGWTSKSRHDAAYIEMPDGQKFVLVVFTENHANDREAIAAVTSKVINGLKEQIKINEPILLIHGEADNNQGTFPIQSERLFAAISGNGGTARLVMLPHESHGYSARESTEHTLYEMVQWFNKYVKNAKPRVTQQAGN